MSHSNSRNWFTGLTPYMPYQLNQFKFKPYQFKLVKLVYRFNIYIIKPVTQSKYNLKPQFFK